MILKRDLIPVQGDPENGASGAGVHKRLNATPPHRLPKNPPQNPL
jgi:hypothetical protein